MSNSSDDEFKLNVTRLLSEVSANQKNLATKIDGYIVANDKRIDDLEHIVNGNGTPGLAEEVRSIKGRWGVMLAVGTIVFTSIVNQVLAHALK